MEPLLALSRPDTRLDHLILVQIVFRSVAVLKPTFTIGVPAVWCGSMPRRFNQFPATYSTPYDLRHPTPYDTPHPIPFTLHPTPYETLKPTPYNLRNPIPYSLSDKNPPLQAPSIAAYVDAKKISLICRHLLTLHPTTYETLHPATPCTPHPSPHTLHPATPHTLHPTPYTL